MIRTPFHNATRNIVISWGIIAGLTLVSAGLVYAQLEEPGIGVPGVKTEVLEPAQKLGTITESSDINLLQRYCEIKWQYGTYSSFDEYKNCVLLKRGL